LAISNKAVERAH